MLVLKRKVSESIHIGKDITIMVTQIGTDYVRIGIEAPKGVLILRAEVPDRTQPRGEPGGQGE